MQVECWISWKCAWAGKETIACSLQKGTSMKKSEIRQAAQVQTVVLEYSLIVFHTVSLHYQQGLYMLWQELQAGVKLKDKQNR